ncbi:MAG: antibiotic biosynthesis monooxygenase [Tannerella sp.]|jgi:quinol monooxygenase YgiN|nr:antibiotic biosynthesis monooxygenase [Tannerella sp.]
MKHFICIVGCVLVAFTGCRSESKTAAEADMCCVANKDSLEIIMNIPMKIKPEYVTIFKTAFDKCRAATMQEEACLAYDLFQSYTDSTEFHLFERWKNKPGHLAHMEQEHLKVYFKEIEGSRDQTDKKMITTIVCPILNPK